jgi:hypothetical protein
LFHWECFHSHGATPIAGWFKNWKILLKLGWFGYTPMT